MMDYFLDRRDLIIEIGNPVLNKSVPHSKYEKNFNWMGNHGGGRNVERFLSALF